MKHLNNIFLSISLIILANMSLVGQQSPVNWTIDTQINDDGSYDLLFKANMPGDWVIYGMDIEDNGPIPTSIYIDTNDNVELVGEVYCTTEAISSYDELFMMDIVKYKHEAIFVQRLSILNLPATITGEVEFMTCDGSRCLPPTSVPFSVDIE